MKSLHKHFSRQKHFNRQKNPRMGETIFRDRGEIHFAERGCVKLRHKTYNAAMKHIRSLVDDGQKRGSLAPYICGDCKFWHVGHGKKRARRPKETFDDDFDDDFFVN